MRSRFGTRLVKAFLSSSYAILYCVLQPVLAGCISCRVFATNGGNQSRKLNKHIDFNEIVKLFSFFSNLVSTCFHRVKIFITQRNHWTSLDSDHLRSYATALEYIFVRVALAWTLGLLSRDSSENWVMTAVSPCQSSTSNRHKCHLPIWLWHRQLSSLGI